MKNQALFSLKDERKKSKCRLLQFWFGALRVNLSLYIQLFITNNTLQPSTKIIQTELSKYSVYIKHYQYSSQLNVTVN